MDQSSPLTHSPCFSSMRLVDAYWAEKKKMKIQPARQALMVHTRDISRVIGMGGAVGGTEHDLDARHPALLNVIHPHSRQLSLLPVFSRCRLS